MKKFASAIAIVFLLCATMLWIARMGAGTALAIKNKGYVTVKGFASESITSDLANVEITLQARDADLSAAYARLAADRDTLKKFLERYNAGVAETGIAPVQVEERYHVTEKGAATNDLDFYIVSQTFRIESKDVSKISRISADAGELLGQGISAVIRPPQYLYTGLEGLKITMIGKATANARERALTLAKNGHFGLGSISEVRVGVFQITPVHSTDVSDYGINDTSSIEKEIKSVVDVRYFVH